MSSDRWIKIRPQKTARSSGVEVEIPMLPELQAALDEGPTGNLTFLVTEYGKPLSIKGLGNKMRVWCDEANLPHCTMHGLRKAGATRAAENGATEKQLMAIFGWTTMQQATYYTEKANRKKMARMGMGFLRKDESGEQKVDEFVSPHQGVEKSETKTPKKGSKIRA